MRNCSEITPNEVPILLLGFNRPDFLKKRILELSSMQVQHLYISIDGGASTNSGEMRDVLNLAENKLKNYKTLNITKNQNNLGLVRHIISAITKVLEKHPYIIVVEDDIRLSPNFFLNMLRGLNMQQNKKLEGIVGGFSILNLSNYSLMRNKWRTSPYSVIWGWGCSRLIWEDYSNVINKKSIKEKLANSQAWNKLSSFQKEVWLGRFGKVAINPEYTWDIQLQFQSFAKNFQNIYPISTLTLNEGYSDLRSTNTKNAKPAWMSRIPPDSRKIHNELAIQTNRKIINLLDSNLFMSDTKIINLYKHKYNLSLPIPH
jgi:hypothetical protein